MTYRALIPNMLTSSNLVFGVCSIFSTMKGDLFWGSLFILIALVADGLDGRAARFFGTSSEIGKEMDSLCDLVSFGVAPGILAYVFCLHAFSWFGCAVAICFALCGAWRLARFNVNVDVVHGISWAWRFRREDALWRPRRCCCRRKASILTFSGGCIRSSCWRWLCLWSARCIILISRDREKRYIWFPKSLFS